MPIKIRRTFDIRRIWISQMKRSLDAVAVSAYLVVRRAVTPVGVVLCVAGCVFHVTPRLFDLTLYLLGGTLSLSACIIGPFANLSFCATGCVIDCSLHLILVH